MKLQTIFLSAGLVALGSYSCFLMSVSLNKDSAEIYIGRDRTDSLVAIPVAKEILSLLNIEEHKWAAVKVRISEITSFDYNSSYSLSLPAKLPLLSNPVQRDSAIEQFKKDLAGQFYTMEQTPTELPVSTIYGPLVRDLNRLAKSKANLRKAVYYTDCRENSSSFSIYNKKQKRFLQEHPGDVQKLFRQMQPAENLKGISVFLVCKPASMEENEDFTLMANLFRTLLEAAGAKVYIGADLNIGD